MAIALEVQNITKHFPGTLANDRVSLTLEKGEVHALLGENGAGKTTLMNIVYGLYHQDEGKVLVDGKEATIRSAQDAIKLGIGMVHQHFMLVPVFTVAENIILGHENTRGGVMLDRRTASQRIREVSQQYGLEIDPDALVKDLPVGIQQRVEIVKALYRNAKILILDEPTAVLTPQEADDLFRIMRGLTARGVSIFFITHKLKEVLAAADRITVLRAGHVVGTTKPAETNEAKLAAMMVGREVILKVDRGPAHPANEVLNVNDLQVTDDRGVMTVNGASFNVRAGEVLGIAGVQGNGQTQLVEALTGLRKVAGGSIHLLGSDVTKSSPRTITELGSAHIPEDRQRHGLVLAYPLTDNMVLNTYYQPPFARGTIMDEARIKQNADKLVEEFDVRTPASTVAVKTLSGGNQQKVIVAREFSRPIKLLIANQPTRGLDVGSIEYIHRRIIEKRDEGCAVLVVSAELDEILALSDRIAVMYHGRIVAVMPSAEATREKLGLLMAGIVSG